MRMKLVQAVPVLSLLARVSLDRESIKGGSTVHPCLSKFSSMMSHSCSTLSSDNFILLSQRHTHRKACKATTVQQTLA